MEQDRYDRQKDRLPKIAYGVSNLVAEKDRQYKSSWRRREGVGAYFTIVRKWDRIEAACEATEFLDRPVRQYDLFQRFSFDTRTEGMLNDWVDLVGYGLVLLEHMVELGYVKIDGDGQLSVTSAGNTSLVDKERIEAPKPLPGASAGRIEHPRPFGYVPEEYG